MVFEESPDETHASVAAPVQVSRQVPDIRVSPPTQPVVALPSLPRPQAHPVSSVPSSGGQPYAPAQKRPVRRQSGSNSGPVFVLCLVIAAIVIGVIVMVARKPNPAEEDAKEKMRLAEKYEAEAARFGTGGWEQDKLDRYEKALKLYKEIPPESSLYDKARAKVRELGQKVESYRGIVANRAVDQDFKLIKKYAEENPADVEGLKRMISNLREKYPWSPRVQEAEALLAVKAPVKKPASQADLQVFSDAEIELDVFTSRKNFKGALGMLRKLSEKFGPENELAAKVDSMMTRTLQQAKDFFDLKDGEARRLVSGGDLKGALRAYDEILNAFGDDPALDVHVAVVRGRIEEIEKSGPLK
jgi:hypothetical protein